MKENEGAPRKSYAKDFEGENTPVQKKKGGQDTFGPTRVHNLIVRIQKGHGHKPASLRE